MTQIKVQLVVPDARVPPGRVASQVIIATPGKAWDLINKSKTLRLDQVKVFVLDEADQMLAKGMQSTVLRIKK